MPTNSLIEENIKALAKYNSLVLHQQPELFKNFDEYHTIRKEVHSGKEVIKFIYRSKEYLLTSKYNPERAAEFLLESVDFSKDSIIFVSGLGLGDHLLKIKERITKDTIVFVYEPNQDLIKYVFSNIDMTQVFGEAPFLLLTGDKEAINFLIMYYADICYNLAYNIQTVILPNYHLYNEQNSYILRKFREVITHTLENFGNSLEDMFVGIRNSYKNIDANFMSNNIEEIKDKYKDIPAIVVSAGPSLDKNIHYIKEAYGKALIIACDASVDACMKQDIVPDVVASIERDEPTYTYYYKDKEFHEDVVLVGPGNLWPKIFEEFPNKKMITQRANYGIDEWWHSFFENSHFMDQGHSSATVAFAVAQKAGCNPIILIGQDLAYSKGKKHSNITHTEDEGSNDDSSWDGTYVQGIHGEKLRSHQIYILFKKWFERKIMVYPEVKVIDATEGGAYIEGSEVLEFKEAIDKYCIKEKEKKLIEHLRDITIIIEEKITKAKEIVNSIDDIKNQLKEVKDISTEYLEELQKIKESYVFEECSQEELEDIIIQMQKGNTIIQDISEKNDITFFFRQIIKQTILHVKKIGNELNAANVVRNLLLQQNLMYMISGSCDLIIEEFDNMEVYIKGKIKEYSV